MNDNSLWIGFDLGGTKMLATVYDRQFNVLGSERKKTKGHQGADKGLARMIETIRAALSKAGVEAADVAGIGVGCPSPVDSTRGVVLDAVNLNWKNVPLKSMLEEEFGFPAEIANDVDVGVFAENRFGAAVSARCVVGVFPGTGIGGGCVYDGRILRGSNSSGMEIGHVQVRRDGRLCGCGRYGCLETESSRLAISANAAAAAFRGEAPYLMKTAGTDVSNIRSSVLAAAIRAGDTAIERIVRQACVHLGTAVGNVISLLLPDVVVLGGGLVEAMPELFVNTVAATAQETVMPPFVDSFKIVAAQLGDDATVLGAAAWAAEVMDESEMTTQKYEHDAPASASGPVERA